MTSLHDLIMSSGGVALRVIAILLLVAQVFLCTALIYHRRKGSFLVLSVIHVLTGLVVLWIMLDGTHQPGQNVYPFEKHSMFVREAFDLPWIVYALYELASAAVLSVCFYLIRQQRRSRLFSGSIKEAVDLLDEGVCFAREDGTVVLYNVKMNGLCRAVSNAPLTNSDRLWDAICEQGEDQNGQKLIRLPDGGTVIFAKDNVTVDSVTYTQMIASDVTEQYRITEELAANNSRLRDIQLRMKALQEKASEMFMSREIMNARSIVHDEVGHALLAAQYYLEHPENTDETVLLTLMRHTNDMLLREKEESELSGHDRYLEAMKMAKGIGVTVQLEGEAPKEGDLRELIGRAIGECAANTVKHAGGDRLYVRISQTENQTAIRIRNNGAPPKEPITETGGLLSLRHAVEEAGGSMTVSSVPEFLLNIIISN